MGCRRRQASKTGRFLLWVMWQWTTEPAARRTSTFALQDFLAPELQKAGYTAIYKKKTTELYTRNA